MKQEANEVLIQRIQHGDEEAKIQFVQRNTALVNSIVQRFVKQHTAREDLFQIGCVGLMKALNNFNLQYGVKFSTYAVPIIMGELKRYFRDDGSMRISRSLKEGYVQYMKVKEHLQQQLSREPTYQEIANETGHEVSDVILCFEANQFTYSLDETIYENDGSAIVLHDKVADQNKEDVVMKLALRQEVHFLSPREQLLIYYRYEQGLKQDDIAKKLNISQVQVSRLEKKILQKLKERLVNA